MVSGIPIQCLKFPRRTILPIDGTLAGTIIQGYRRASSQLNSAP